MTFRKDLSKTSIKIVAAALLSVICLLVVTAQLRSQPGTVRLGHRMHFTDVSRQLVVVIVDDWTSTRGVLRRYDRAPDGSWRGVGDSVLVVIGRNGLAWGRGIHPPFNNGSPINNGRVKLEGDGCAPAGAFRFGTAFGYAPIGTLVGLKLPYQQLTSGIECVDDTASILYNRIVDSAHATSTWNSSEKMSRAGEFYRWGVVVEHNTSPVNHGSGSCIFLHCWGGPTVTTSGCTAMEPTAMTTILTWLDPAKNPIFVQLPRNDYLQRRVVWGLPLLQE